jgi:hypothetical protein
VDDGSVAREINSEAETTTAEQEAPRRYRQQRELIRLAHADWPRDQVLWQSSLHAPVRREDRCGGEGTAS